MSWYLKWCHLFMYMYILNWFAWFVKRSGNARQTLEPRLYEFLQLQVMEQVTGCSCSGK